MTERGLPIVDGAPACPFVAFEDDRDERATSPDHRHRCYAEIRPAPRAFAHQEAYCLSSAFPVCPTFQDWARREAARARAAGSAPPPAPEPAPEPAPDEDLLEGLEAAPIEETPRAAPPGSLWGADEPAPGEGPRRNPPRDWSAPPPWAAGDQGAAEAGVTGAALGAGAAAAAGAAAGSLAGPSGDEDAAEGGAAEGSVDAPGFLSARNRSSTPAAAGLAGGAAAGLAGSAADRLAGAVEEYDGPFPARPREAPGSGDGGHDAEGFADDASEGSLRGEDDDGMRRFGRGRGDAGGRERPPGRRPRVGDTRSGRPASELGGAPAWEHPRRYEAYPSLRSRMTLPGLPTMPPIALMVGALVIAAVALFFLPALLGLGDQGAGPGASPSGGSPSAAVSSAPSQVAEPTPQVYVVRLGDTMSKIAKRFGVTLDALIAANKTKIPDPNKIALGDEVIIPAAGEEPSPS